LLTVPRSSLRHLRSVTYSVALALLNKHEI